MINKMNKTTIKQNQCFDVAFSNLLSLTIYHMYTVQICTGHLPSFVKN